MTHVTCRLTAKNRDQLRNPTLGNRVWATYTFFAVYGQFITLTMQYCLQDDAREAARRARPSAAGDTCFACILFYIEVRCKTMRSVARPKGMGSEKGTCHWGTSRPSIPTS